MANGTIKVSQVDVLTTSGTGTISIVPPATNTDRTLTLPDQTATVATLTTPSFGTTIGVGGATASSSGAGVTFPATQSASTDANTLDDYEEGTWTPTITPESGSYTTTSYTAANCTYTKIGNKVTVNIRWQVDSFGTGSGGCKITGLPFSIGSSQRGSGSGINGSNAYCLSVLVYDVSNYIVFYKYDATFTSGDFQGKGLSATVTYTV